LAEKGLKGEKRTKAPEVIPVIPGLSGERFGRIIQVMADEPRKIFDLMDTETEPTDEQLAELMRLVGEDIRAESARIRARDRVVIPPATRGM
jgi:hypothetical protein